MKTEYKNRSVELLTGADSRIEKILEMLEGIRPADQKLATQILKEVRITIDKVSQLIELS
jgi:predicted transcriptional regulator